MMAQQRARPVEPFADLHVENGKVRAILLHDPSVEGLDMAMYVDGSASMREELARERDSEARPRVRPMLQYLASKDRNGLLRLAWWGCGPAGRDIEVVGEMSGPDVERQRFFGPRQIGTSTALTPALEDYVGYLRTQVADGARQGCAIVVTDRRIDDADEVKAFSQQVARQIGCGRLPRTNFILVGVGDRVDPEQLEHIGRDTFPGIGPVWRHRTAADLDQVADVVAGLVDATMTVAAGGAVVDDAGRVLKIYEGRLPAVLEFDIPEDCRQFTLEVNGQRYNQPLAAAYDDDHAPQDYDDDTAS
jgi:hypothetical protein